MYIVIQYNGSCTEYPTTGKSNRKVGILVVGYSGQNGRNTQQWNVI